jgi:hypothetical protein
MEYSDAVPIKTETSLGPIFDAYAVQTEKINKSEINPWFRGSPADMQTSRYLAESGCIPLAGIKGELNKAYTYKVLQVAGM